jgi:ArsR family transcriptional regulator
LPSLVQAHEPGGHLAAAGVVHAHEEHLGLVVGDQVLRLRERPQPLFRAKRYASTGTKSLIREPPSRIEGVADVALDRLDREDPANRPSAGVGGHLANVMLGNGIQCVALSRPRYRRRSMRECDKDIDLCQSVSVKSIATLTATCPPLLAGPLDADEAVRLAQALKVIADPARLRLLSLIRAQPTGEACVCHLTEPLGLSQPTVSHHLKVLLEAGLVEREQRGSWAYFRVVPETLAVLRDSLL